MIDDEWKRIGNDYLFEQSVRDKSGRQITLLQSWRKLVAVILHDTKTIVRTKKHYQYNVTMALDKLAKQQKMTSLMMDENTFYKLLCDKLGEKHLYQNWDKDVEYSAEEEEDYEPEGEPDEDEYPWDDEETE